jgi:hypothetical protein
MPRGDIALQFRRAKWRDADLVDCNSQVGSTRMQKVPCFLRFHVLAMNSSGIESVVTGH